MPGQKKQRKTSAGLRKKICAPFVNVMLHNGMQYKIEIGQRYHSSGFSGYKNHSVENAASQFFW